jgi:hypothetical protein
MTETIDGRSKFSVCPPLIPDRKGKKFTFFESVLVARQKLIELIIVENFLVEMLDWAGRQGNKSERYFQNVLNAYFLVGLIPYTRLAKSSKQQLVCTFITTDDLQDVRQFCLSCVTKRLDKMALFWCIAHSIEPFDTTKLLESLDITFEDAKRRIRLLRNLGALQKAGNDYSLSPSGCSFATHISPTVSYQIFPQEVLVKESDRDDQWDTFGNFIEWQ